MTIPPGSYSIGPEQATLTVHTRKGGAAARAGHDLRIEVTAWSAELRAGEAAGATEMRLTADSSSLEVREGTGGLQPLGDGDRAEVKKRIDDEVLRRAVIEFRSTSVEPGRDRGDLRVHGELDLLGARRAITVELRIADDGGLTGRATVTQSDFGIKPYSALFGALKVLDEVQVTLDGRLPVSRRA